MCNKILRLNQRFIRVLILTSEQAYKGVTHRFDSSIYMLFHF